MTCDRELRDITTKHINLK